MADRSIFASSPFFASLVADVSVVRYYVNGEPVADDQFGFFIGNAGQGIPIECRNNAACNQQTGQASLAVHTSEACVEK